MKKFLKPKWFSTSFFTEKLLPLKYNKLLDSFFVLFLKSRESLIIIQEAAVKMTGINQKFGFAGWPPSETALAQIYTHKTMLDFFRTPFI